MLLPLNLQDRGAIMWQFKKRKALPRWTIPEFKKANLLWKSI